MTKRNRSWLGVGLAGALALAAAYGSASAKPPAAGKPGGGGAVERGAQIVHLGGCNHCHTPWMFDAAVGMPVPAVTEALSKGVIDGTTIPWEVTPSLKIAELVKHHTGFTGSTGLFTQTFAMVMSRGSYEKLPADLKKVLDANSGMPAATMAGRTWDDAGAAVLAMVSKRSGNVISEISVDEAGRWRKTTQPVIDAWVASAKDRNLDGAKLVEAVRALVQKYKVS